METKFFGKDRIFLDKEFKEANELFNFVSDELEKKGLVGEGFCESIKEREANFPTALPGKVVDIAVPHTDPNLVNRPFIMVIRTTKGVPFIQMGSENLVIYPQIFFVLGFQKKGAMEYQVKILKLLIEHFILNDDGNNSQEFMDAKTVDDCMKILENIEEKLVSNN